LPRVVDVLAYAGIDVHRLAALTRMRRYLSDRRRFLERGGIIDVSRPMLFDYAANSGVAGGHYFHQDLLVAQYIHEAKPLRHIDIGSRIDGFVAHVAALREIEVMDVRPLGATGQSRISFLQADLSAPLPDHLGGAFDSVSCLHALEHFGLGRYGDRLDPDGHLKGFENLLAMVQPGGRLYLGLPVGQARVEFNSQRVFAPGDPVTWAAGRLSLAQFDFVDDSVALVRSAQPADVAMSNYACGIYTFRRPV
jgi:SAM-dependent methyltransferase